MSQKRVMSGMRPTGKLHLGHYVGVIQNWLAIQHDYACHFMIADWHALTTNFDDTSNLKTHILEVACDWLGCGIDPNIATMYVQSHVPQTAELHVLLSMITPKKWVETDPTIKDMVTSAQELHYGLLGYPILQTADILIVRGEYVPVGKDQLAHLEVGRDIITRFNHLYKSQFFQPIKPLLTETPLLTGLDGRKMGKSLNNGIYLSDTEDETWAKLKKGMTDPGRIQKTDAGNPEACGVIYKYHEVFTSVEAQKNTAIACETAARGCMDCKKELADSVIETLRPIRERRALYYNDLAQVEAILKAGAEKARHQADLTMAMVKAAVNLY
jgi:tryptophanyl-tRNA synthetase